MKHRKMTLQQQSGNLRFDSKNQDSAINSSQHSSHSLANAGYKNAAQNNQSNSTQNSVTQNNAGKNRVNQASAASGSTSGSASGGGRLLTKPSFASSGSYSQLSQADILIGQKKGRIYKKRLLHMFYVVLLCSVCYAGYNFRLVAEGYLNQAIRAYGFVFATISSKIPNISKSLDEAIVNVNVEGLNLLDKRAILAHVYVYNDSGKVMPMTNLQEMREGIMSIPFVKNVSIHRSFAGESLTIKVEERQPIGLLIEPPCAQADVICQADEDGADSGILVKKLILDKDGEAIDGSMAGVDGLGLIKINDLDSDEYFEFVDLYEVLQKLDIIDDVAEANFISGRRWNLVFKNGFLVKLPSRDWVAAVDILLKINDKIGVLSPDNKFIYADLRVPNKIFFK